jgi:hypothetical protein
MIRLLRLLILPMLALLIASALLVTSWFYTFQRLTQETPIAEISFDPLGDKVYRASLSTGDRCRVEHYDIYGDEWRVDARFIKWKYGAMLFGLDSMYRLDRIEGRYQDVDEQNRRHTQAYALPPATAIDAMGLAAGLGRLGFLLDTRYGSSTFDSIDVGREYRVYKTQTGLITRSQPRSRTASGGENLSIEIDRSCGRSGGGWRALSNWFDRTIMGSIASTAFSSAGE